MISRYTGEGGTRFAAVIPNVEARWYALQTRYRHEKFVGSQLDGRHIANFLPLLKRVSRWSDRRKEVQLPLFSGYIFVRVALSQEARIEILRTRGVLSLVGAQGQGTPIPDRQIDCLQTLLTHDVPVASYPFLKTGQRVRVRGGCMDGIEGILAGGNGRRSLVISVDMIERSLAIRVEGFDVEAA